MKKGDWGSENTRHAHQFLPRLCGRGKKECPITGQLQGFAAPSTRYGAQSPACCRVCAFEQLVQQFLRIAAVCEQVSHALRHRLPRSKQRLVITRCTIAPWRSTRPKGVLCAPFLSAVVSVGTWQTTRYLPHNALLRGVRQYASTALKDSNATANS